MNIKEMIAPNISWNEINLNKKRLKSLSKVFLQLSLAYVIYTQTGIESFVENLIINLFDKLHLLDVLFHMNWFKFAFLGTIIFWAKDIWDKNNRIG